MAINPGKSFTKINVDYWEFYLVVVVNYGEINPFQKEFIRGKSESRTEL
jgi:hypothetical protein